VSFGIYDLKMPGPNIDSIYDKVMGNTPPPCTRGHTSSPRQAQSMYMTSSQLLPCPSNLQCMSSSLTPSFFLPVSPVSLVALPRLLLRQVRRGPVGGEVRTQHLARHRQERTDAHTVRLVGECMGWRRGGRLSGMAVHWGMWEKVHDNVGILNEKVGQTMTRV
jgi:hypothetical protein